MAGLEIKIRFTRRSEALASTLHKTPTLFYIFAPARVIEAPLCVYSDGASLFLS